MEKNIFRAIFLSLVLVFTISSSCSADLNRDTARLASKALETTVGYERPIIGAAPEIARELYNEYKDVYAELQTFLKESGTSIEDYNCILRAASIVNLRRVVLMDYLILADAYKNGRKDRYDEITRNLYADWDAERITRQSFSNDYGF